MKPHPWTTPTGSTTTGCSPTRDWGLSPGMPVYGHPGLRTFLTSWFQPFIDRFINTVPSFRREGWLPNFSLPNSRLPNLKGKTSLPNSDTIELFTAEFWHYRTIHCRTLTLSNYSLPNSDTVELYTAELWHCRTIHCRIGPLSIELDLEHQAVKYWLN